MEKERIQKRIEELERKLESFATKDEISDAIAKIREERNTIPIGGEMATMTLPEVIRKRAKGDEEREIQKVWDSAYIASKILKIPVEQTKSFRKLTALIKQMDGTPGKGAEWIPTEMSREVIDLYELAAVVEAQHPSIDLPHSGYKIPTKTSRSTVYLGTALTAPTKSSVGTGNITLDAKELCAWVPFAYSLEEDAVIAQLPMLREDIATGLAENFEFAMINGHDGTLGITFDTDIGATDPAKGYNGYRAWAIKHSLTEDFGFTAWDTDTNLTTILDHLREMVSAMGKYGVDTTKLFWLVSPKINAKLTALNNLRAKPVVKEAGRTTLDGIPVLVSGQMRDDLNASGVYDGSVVNRSGILLVFKPGWIVGSIRQITIESEKDIKARGVDVVGSMRKAFTWRYDPASEPIVMYGFNVAY